MDSSPLGDYREVIGADTPSVADFIEHLIVRRHLAFNFVYYNPLYDSFEGLPQWAKRTLSVHQEDVRENLYTFPAGGRKHPRISTGMQLRRN